MGNVCTQFRLNLVNVNLFKNNKMVFDTCPF